MSIPSHVAAELKKFENAKQRAARQTALRAIAHSSDDLQRAIADSRPKIALPGPDRLLSEFAIELSEHVRDKDIYLRN
jgi:hypothetical protein